MPTYDYRCPRCDAEVEIFHGMNEDPEIACDCEDEPVVMLRIISCAPGFVLKGSGWFEDGY